jgi:hypothetical protein
MKTRQGSDSPLFGASSIGLIAKLLNVEKKHLVDLHKKRHGLYSESIVLADGKAPRKTQVPKKDLKKVLASLKGYLNDLAVPGYFMSAKGQGYIKNNNRHSENSNLSTFDINAFFPSCKIEYVFRFFKFKMKMPDDVAWFLADLTTYKSALATGSPVSPILAFWMNKEIFDGIDARCRKHQQVFTLYVDDIGISSNQKQDPKLYAELRYLLSKQDLVLKKEKVKIYPSGATRICTGVVTKNGKREAKYRSYKKLFRIIKSTNDDLSKLTIKDLRRACGMIYSMQQISEAKEFGPLLGSLREQLRAKELDKPK